MHRYLIQPAHLVTGITECATLEMESRFSYPGITLVFAEKLDATRLHRALSRVLDDFPQYAGKLKVGLTHLQILHGRGPAVFETATTDLTLSQAMPKIRAGHTAHFEPKLSKLRVARGREACLLLRLTQLRDGAVLSVAWNHVVGDTHSTMLLLRALSAAYSGRPHDAPQLITDRDAFLSEKLPKSSRARSAVRLGTPWQGLKVRMKIFRPAEQVSLEYSSAELLALKQTLRTAEPISANDALCAHVASVLRELSGAADPTNLCLVVNYRTRLGLDARLVGNLTSIVCRQIDELDTPAEVALGLRRALRDYATKYVTYHPSMRVVRCANTALARLGLISREFDPGSGDLFITNWNNFGLYDLTFEGHKPLLYQPITLGMKLPQWFVIIYDLPHARGVGIRAGLPPAVAARWNSAEGQALLHRPLAPAARAHERRVELGAFDAAR